MKQIESLPWIQHKNGIFMKLTSENYNCKEMTDKAVYCESIWKGMNNIEKLHYLLHIKD